MSEQETKLSDTGLVATRRGGPVMRPKSLEEAIKFADFISKSNLVPTAYKGKPADIVVAMLHGAEVGLAPLQSLQSIAVINGNPAMYGDAPLALVSASGLLEWIKETDDGQMATCTVKRRGDPNPKIGTFSMKQAQSISQKYWDKGSNGWKTFALASKDTWKNYPERMRKLRARGFALRDAFPDVLKGIGAGEEIDDFIEIKGEHVEQEPITMPKRASEANGGTGKTAAAEPPTDQDQRTPESESDPGTQVQEGADEIDVAALTAEVSEWIATAPADDIIKGTDKFFTRITPLPDSAMHELVQKFQERQKEIRKKNGARE